MVQLSCVAKSYSSFEEVSSMGILKTLFGTGSGKGSGGSRTFTAPVHGCDSQGKPVTAAFGKGTHKGETLISSGHAKSMSSFYGSKGNKGHDHFGPKGQPYADRGKYKK